MSVSTVTMATCTPSTPAQVRCSGSIQCAFGRWRAGGGQRSSLFRRLGQSEALYALNANTGALLWSYPIGGYGYVRRRWSTAWCTSVQVTCYVYALDASTGALLWKYAIGDYAMFATPDGGQWCGLRRLRGPSKRLRAGRRHRRLLGSSQRPILVGTSPAVANGMVYVDSDTVRLCAKREYGRALWKYATDRTCESSPGGGEWRGLCRCRRQRICPGRRYRRLAVEVRIRRRRRTLRRRWPMAWSMSAPRTTNVYALNASTGALLWKYTTANCVDVFAGGGQRHGIHRSTTTGTSTPSVCRTSKCRRSSARRSVPTRLG